MAFPNSLPALIKAYRVQDKARNVGFDGKNAHKVWEKVKEELAEFEAEVENMDKGQSRSRIWRSHVLLNQRSPSV